MAFGGDLPYFPNLLSGSPSKQEIPNKLGGDRFSMAGSNSSNALVPNNVHHFDHAVPINGSNLIMSTLWDLPQTSLLGFKSHM